VDNSIKRMLGILDEGKRIYRFVSGEVTRDEYEFCQSLDALLFGDRGYIETLGPTWSLVSDPRFTKIEDAFIVNRRAIFGGDAMTGKQYISSDGQFTSSIADLEEYSEVLGEGRYFYYVLVHPDKECPLRNWYLRIFPTLVKEQGITIPVPGTDLQCECRGASQEPRSMKNAPDEYLWALIKKECPNYFTKEDKPNGVATRLFALFRADLLGLIADYAVTPLSDVFVELDTGDVLKEQEAVVTPHVFLEVDILEKALTQRAVLRATAARILRQMGFQKIIKDELGDNFRLTDIERDQLLRLVYNPPNIGTLQIDPGTNWYGYLHVIEGVILDFVRGIKKDGRTVEEREQEQLLIATQRAQETFTKLKSGEIQSINQYTEPEVDVKLDPHAVVMQAVLKNPFKQELFMLWAEAERLSGNDIEDNDLRMRMSKLYSILTPIFTDPDFVVGEEEYAQYMDEADKLGFFGYNTMEVEEEFHGEARGMDTSG